MTRRNSKQMLTCSATLPVKQALALRDLGIKLEFRCPHCAQPVKAVGEGKDKSGVKYKAHFEHKSWNPQCRFTVAEMEAFEKLLRTGRIVKEEPILAGTAYFGRAEAEFANAIGEEKDAKRGEEMDRRYKELAERLKSASREERERTLLDEIAKWKRELSSRS